MDAFLHFKFLLGAVHFATLDFHQHRFLGCTHCVTIKKIISILPALEYSIYIYVNLVNSVTVRMYCCRVRNVCCTGIVATSLWSLTMYKTRQA
jgi:hypothetical protein